MNKLEWSCKNFSYGSDNRDGEKTVVVIAVILSIYPFEFRSQSVAQASLGLIV